ncbi:MAG: hypothetical protein AB1797_08150, partial [bacterium]
IYTGFCANLCIVDSPAAMKAMNGLGYRCVLLREGTLIGIADRLIGIADRNFDFRVIRKKCHRSAPQMFFSALSLMS